MFWIFKDYLLQNRKLSIQPNLKWKCLEIKYWVFSTANVRLDGKFEKYKTKQKQQKQQNIHIICFELKLEVNSTLESLWQQITMSIFSIEICWQMLIFSSQLANRFFNAFWRPIKKTVEISTSIRC